MTWTPGPVVTRRRLGSELRRLRDHAGLKLDEVARRLECSPSKISRLENGRGVPRWRDVRDLLDVYEVAGSDERERLLEWSKTGQRPMWWSPYADILPAQISTYIELEWDAVRICAYEPYVVHGLLQTREYARAVQRAIEGAAHEHARVERMVDVRLQRQEALSPDHGLTFTCVLDESALYRVVGSPQIQKEQLGHLIGMARAGHVDVRVLPFTGGLSSSGHDSFSLLEFGEDVGRTIGYVGRFSGEGDFYTEPSAIERLEGRWEALCSVAHPERESIVLLERAVHRLVDA